MDTAYIELKRVIAELLDIIRGSKIENLYVMDDESVVLKVKADKIVGELRIAPGKCVYFTRGSYEKPLSLSSRGRALRNIVSGARIRDVKLTSGERIVVFDLETREGKLRLVAELMPRGTVAVVDREGRIIESLHHLRMRDRVIAPGEVYRLPPPKFSAVEKVGALFDMLSPKKTLVSALASQAGLGGRYAEEVVKLAGVDGSRRVDELSEDERGLLKLLGGF